MNNDKASRIQKNIKSTIENAAQTAGILHKTDNKKEQQELLDKNARRAQAVDSLIRDMKEAEAQSELDEMDI